MATTESADASGVPFILAAFPPIVVIIQAPLPLALGSTILSLFTREPMTGRGVGGACFVEGVRMDVGDVQEAPLEFCAKSATSSPDL